MEFVSWCRRKLVTMKAKHTILGITLFILVGSCADQSTTHNNVIADTVAQIDTVEQVDTLQESSIEMKLDKSETLPGFLANIEMKMLMISSAQFSPYTDIVIEDINYQLVQNQQGDTTYLSTQDPKFVTQEGYKIGSKWENLAISDRENVTSMPGWGYLIGLESGWQLGFCEGYTCTDNPPTKASEVKWIFKRSK